MQNNPPNWYNKQMREGYLLAQKQKERARELRDLLNPIRRLFRKRR